ncbi:MAG: S24/S26 family peptidase, partial [Bacteroidales bacterium]|nr:S24/S26 family peptidase [Bacteroidales bacterium]
MVLPNALMLGEVKRLVRQGFHVTIRTKGNSMLPFIRGEIDSVELSLPEVPYAKGDIVLAEVEPDHYILHRIWEMRGEKVILMGDGNCRGKEKCRYENLIAKV